MQLYCLKKNVITLIRSEIQKVTKIHIGTKNKPNALILFEKECNYSTHFSKNFNKIKLRKTVIVTQLQNRVDVYLILVLI